jgi:hypothetical protein
MYIYIYSQTKFLLVELRSHEVGRHLKRESTYIFICTMDPILHKVEDALGMII